MRTLFVLLLCGCSSPANPGAGWFEISAGPDTWLAYGAFEELPPSETDCVQKAGDCQWLPPGCNQTAESAHVSIGTIAIDDGFHKMQVNAIKKDGSYGLGGSDSAFQPDDPVRVTAPGAALDGFDTRITMPERSTIDPVPSPAPRDRDLVVTWTGGSGNVQIGVYFTEGEIFCVFDAAKKSGTIPASLLGNLPTGETGSLASNNRVEVRVRENLTLGADVYRGDGFAISFQ